MPSAADRIAAARDQRLSVGALISEAVRRAREGGFLLLCVAIGMALAAIGLSDLGAIAAPPESGWGVARIAIVLLSFAASGVGCAAALQLMLGGRIRLDGGFVGGGLLLLGAEIAMVAPAYLNAMIPLRLEETYDLVIRNLVVSLSSPFIGLVLARYALWTAGMLVGRRDAGPRWSAARMHGAMLPWALACLTVAVPFLVLTTMWTVVTVYQGGEVKGNWQSDPLIAGPVGAVWRIYAMALAAAVYRLRVESSRGVAHVFD